VSQEQSEDLTTRRTERHSHTDFLPPFAHALRDDPINPIAARSTAAPAKTESTIAATRRRLAASLMTCSTVRSLNTGTERSRLRIAVSIEEVVTVPRVRATANTVVRESADRKRAKAAGGARSSRSGDLLHCP
jgi:hypothetical protein